MSLPHHSVETIGNTSIAYKYKISHQSKIIYTMVLLVVIGALIAMPFIKVQISVRSASGELQPSMQKQQLYAPITGRITQLRIKDNQKIKQGDTLLLIDSSVPKIQKDLLQTRLTQINQNLQDATSIINSLNLGKTVSPGLKTGQYRASWQHYVQQRTHSDLAKEQAERIHKRNISLYRSNVLTAAEFEKSKFDLEKAKSDFMLIEKNYKSECQMAANTYRSELRQLQSSKEDYNDQQQQRILRAPVTGSVQSINGIHTGSYIIAGHKIADISPEGNLYAFCYIKPSDIGLIHEGQDARLQIEAFNYNQWGLIGGKVIDIADDIVLLNNQPFFKVKCSLDKNYLQLKNGYKGYFKKGMSFTGRFAVTKRSLFQLVYDKVDNWVNPNK